MSQIAYANPRAARPALGPATTRASSATAARGRRAAWIPLTISLVAHWLFFIQYWVPETGTFPARDWWLTQLSPLVSPALTSRGDAQVPAQEDQLGIAAFIWLIAGFALYWLSRTRAWWGRTAMVLPAAVGTLAALGTFISLLVGGQLSHSAVAAILMLGWVVTAGYAAVQGLQDHLGPVPVKTRRAGLVLLAAYAIIGLAPIAVGRWLFAPELRDTAAILQSNSVSLRLAALWTTSSWLLYLCGLLVGGIVWVAYQWWPPRRERRFGGLSLALVGLVIFTGVIGFPTATIAAKRVTTLLYASPTTDVHFTCGSWVLDQPELLGQAEPKQTMIISGFTCKTVTTFSGYRQLGTRALPVSLSPVTAHTPSGRRISGKIVVAEYPGVIVVAGSDRIDTSANQLIGLGIGDAAELWRLRCPKTLAVRFAVVPAGDNPDLGHITRDETEPTVVATCEDKILRFDPLAGPS